MSSSILTRVALLLAPVLIASTAAAQGWSVLGTSADRLGWSVASAGDVNGDGRDDVIVGLPGNDNANGTDAGAANVYSGTTGALLYTFLGPSGNSGFGLAVAGIGDVNGDGRSEVIVGAPYENTLGYQANGSARVYSGANGALLYMLPGGTVSNQVWFGWSVAGVGDVDGDGRPDFAVGAPYYSGAGYVSIFSGATGITLASVGAEALGDSFGYSVAGAGDVNGDGRADVLVGAPATDIFGTNTGSAYVLSLALGFPQTLYRADGSFSNGNFGASVASVGDVDGDGRPDFIVGAYRSGVSVFTGQAMVFSGASGTLVYTLSGDSNDDQFGFAVSGAGDMDGDGRGDFFVGAPLDDNNGPNTGSVRAFSGRDGSVLFTFNPSSGEAGHSIGRGDFNGDGRMDFVVGGPRFLNGGQEAGAAWVYAGVSTFSFCSGDGSGTACPCGNIGAAGRGCPNSVAAYGAYLCVGGNASVGADTVSIGAFDMPLSTSLFVQGTERQNGGAGVMFGDGLLCIGGSVVRLGTKMNSSSAGGCAFGSGTLSNGATYPGPGDPSISQRGQVPASGGTRHYQVWYRNGAAFCTSATFNLTNAVTIVWVP